MSQKHSHYHKDVSHLKSIDIYRMLELFGVTDQALGHAVKKLICAGQRGSKSFEQDVREAVDTLNRRLQMLAEDDNSRGVQAPRAPIPGYIPPVQVPMPQMPIGLSSCLICGEPGGHFGMSCPKAVPVAHFGTVAKAPAPAPLPKQYESYATHRDGGGSKYMQDPTGRWLRWGLDSWFFYSDDPKEVPEGLRPLPAYDGHD